MGGPTIAAYNSDMSIPLRELQFDLFDVLGLAGSPSTRETFQAVLEDAEILADEQFASHAALVDSQEHTMVKGGDVLPVELM